MWLNSEDIGHLTTGANFNACAADPDWCREESDRALALMRRTGRALELRPIEEFDADALIVAVGFVNNGLPLSDLRPVGDEFQKSLGLIEEALGRTVDGLMPLAAGNVNAIVPIVTGLQLDLPIVDADPMGRILPLVDQTVFTLAGLSAGPVAATGAAGESALVNVMEPARAEQILRALARAFGGWAATATYPMRAETLGRTGVIGSISRMLRIGQILESPLETPRKYDALRRFVKVRQIIRARVSNSTWLAPSGAPGQVGHPSSLVFIEEGQGRIIQVELQNELLMVMIDGAVRAVVPDLITMLRPDNGSVASLEDLWAGNMIDIVVMWGAEQWYTPEGIRLAEPAAFEPLRPR